MGEICEHNLRSPCICSPEEIAIFERGKNFQGDAKDARIKELEAENAELKCDLSKPPQERSYCQGCTLPSYTKDLEAEVEKLEGTLITIGRCGEVAIEMKVKEHKATEEIAKKALEALRSVKDLVNRHNVARYGWGPGNTERYDYKPVMELLSTPEAKRLLEVPK